LTLSRESFAWYGYDHLAAPLDEALASVRIRDGEPRAPVVEDAIFVPAMKVGLHLFEGAVLTSDGQPVPQAVAQRRLSRMGDITLGTLSEPVALRPERVIDDEVVYLGWYFDHFGHFLLESLARAWVLPALDPAITVVMHRERDEEPAGITRQMLDLLGVPRERILFLDGQTRLRRVVVPEPLYEIAHAAHPRMPEPYRRIADALVPNDAPTDQPVYLSRRLLSSRQRPIIGELELEEVMRENGFLIVYPESMALVDQLRVVHRHRQVFTSAGSAAYLTLFARQPPHLHLLTAGVPFPDYFLTPTVAGVATSFVNCLAGGERLAAHYLPQLAQLDLFAGYLDSLGLLKRRLRSSLAARALDLRPAYDESWFYKYVRHGLRTEELPADLEAEATRRAATSWPLSWTLARYRATHDPEGVEPLLDQFMALVARESDVDRLAHYRDDIAGSLKQVLRRCSPETAARLRAVLRDRLLIEPAADPGRGGERRRPRAAATAPSPAGQTVTAAT
jgi:hypothetical protein